MNKAVIWGLAVIIVLFLVACEKNNNNSLQSSIQISSDSTSETSSQGDSLSVSGDSDSLEANQHLSIQGTAFPVGDDRFSFSGDITAATKADSMVKSEMIADMGNVVSEIQVSSMDVSNERSLAQEEVSAIISVLQNSNISVYDKLENPPTGGDYFNLIAFNRNKEIYMHLSFNGEWIFFRMMDGTTVVFNGENSGLEKIRDIVSSKHPLDNLQSQDKKLMSDEDIFTLFSELNEKALPVLFWYFSDTEESLQIDINARLQTDSDYRKVGRFKTIAEMKAATEEVFSKDFCNALFYDHAFVRPNGAKPMYKEVDGTLYRNINIGGFGWPYKLTDEYTVVLQREKLIVLYIKTNVVDHDEWITIVLKNEDGAWRIGKYYELTPYSMQQKAIAPAVSAWLCAKDWDNANDLDANSLLVFYADQYLSEVKSYNVANGFSVPAKKVFDDLTKHFDNLKFDTLTKVKDEEYTSAIFDEATDSFIFYLTRDPANFVVCYEEGLTHQSAVIDVLVIGKNDKASYWGKLAVEPTKDGLKYISNQYTDIPEENADTSSNAG